MHTTQVHFCRSVSVFAMSNCLCIIANALKTKTKKAVILSLDCPLFSGEAGIRTLGPASWSTVFETAPIDHSGISPFVSGLLHEVARRSKTGAKVLLFCNLAK